jgi:flagellar FliJ protein
MFRFRLQPLLQLRESERDQRRADLAKALRAEEVLRGELEKLRAQQREAAGRAQALKAPGAADIDALLGMHRYEVLLAAQHKQLANQLAQVEAECERRRLALVEADRGVRVLEKLRERRAAEHQRQELRREAKQLDEVATTGFLHKQEMPA